MRIGRVIAGLLILTLIHAQPRARPNVVLITIDTLRADHLGCYGYEQIETPYIDALAVDGIRFRTTVAQVPLTLPSHACILTGTYPMFHGVRDNVGYRLVDAKTTLAEILKPYGYHSAAFVGAYILNSKFGLDQGFDLYDDQIPGAKKGGGIINLNEIERRAGEVIDRTIAWLEKSGRSPFFAWIHLFDPHDPYDPPARFRRLYSTRPYDGEIAYVDQEVGRLISFLKGRKLYDDSLLIVVSDHGEAFGEHREFTHGYFVYDTTLLVPLIVKLPRQAHKGRTVDRQVRTTDIVPTILQLLEIARPAEVQGAGMLGLMLGRPVQWPREAYAETYYPLQFGWSPLRSLRQAETKYIAAPKPELYNLARDAGETSNNIAKNTALAGSLKSRLTELEAAFSDKSVTKQSAVPMKPDELERLAALSYVGGAVRGLASISGFAKLPDPKDKLSLYVLISEAGQSAARGDYSVATRTLRQVVDQDPSVAAAWLLMGRCYYNREDYGPAREAFERLLRLNPKSLEAQFFVAACDFYQDRLDSAEAGMKKVIEQDPEYSYAHKYLGFIHQSRGQIQPAIDAFRESARISPDDEEAHLKLGFLYGSEGRFQDAEIHFKRAIELDPANAATHYNLGITYVKMNQRDLAEKELREACRLDSKYCAPPP